MGSYASVAIRDEYGNIVGYQSTRTGEVVEAASPEYQAQVRAEGRAEEARTGRTIEPNPYDPYSAAGIAYNVARTGGATDIRLNLIAEQEIAAVGGDPSFIRYATNIYQEREPISSSTVTTREGQTFYNRGFEGVPVRLNLTRNEMQNVNDIVSGDSNRYLVYNQDTRNLERLSPQSQLAVDYGVHKARGDFGGPLLEGGTYGGWKSGHTVEERRAAVALGVTTPETRVLGSRYQTTPRSAQGAEAAINAGALPKPFTSANIRKPFTSTNLKIESPSGATPVQESKAPSQEYVQSVFGGYSGGILGYLAFGEKSPKVIKGAVGSVIDAFPSMVGFTPIADTMREQDTGYKDYLKRIDASKSELTNIGEYGKRTFGTDTEGKIILPSDSKEAVAFKEDYERSAGKYSKIVSEGIEKEYLSVKEGEIVSRPDIATFEYGEFSKWGAGAGAQVRKTLGFNRQQLEAYGETIERKRGLETIPEKIVYGTGFTLSTQPEKFVTGAGVGATFVLGGEVVGGVAASPAIASRLGPFAASNPIVVSAARAAVNVGVPTAFGGLTYYEASEHFTATPERTTVNIGKMVPELAGLGYGGAGVVGVAGLAERGFVGFGTKKVEYVRGYQPRAIDLSNVKLSDTKIGTVESPLDIPQYLVEKPSLREPFVLSGKTRYSFDVLKEETLPIRPMSELPSVRNFMTGEEIQKVSTASGFSYGGPATFEQMRTVAEFKRLGDVRVEIPGNIAPSPKTLLMREKQASQWIQPVRSPTGEMPWDFLPGTGKGGFGELRKPALSGAPDFVITTEMAAKAGIRVEPARIGESTPLGTKFSGSPMSSQMLESVVNVDIMKGVSRTSYYNVETTIRNIAVRSRIKSPMSFAEEQRVLPSATRKTFAGKGFAIEKSKFDEALTGAIESEKRSADFEVGRRIARMEYPSLKKPSDVSIASIPKEIPAKAQLRVGRMAVLKEIERGYTGDFGTVSFTGSSKRSSTIESMTSASISRNIKSEIPDISRRSINLPDITPSSKQKRMVGSLEVSEPGYPDKPFARITETKPPSMPTSRRIPFENVYKTPVVTPIDVPGTTKPPTINKITEITPPFAFFGGPGGGGSRGPMGSLGSTRWQRTNLVADMPYLARGMRSFGFSALPSDMYKETYRKGRRTKKKSSGRKKK